MTDVVTNFPPQNYSSTFFLNATDDGAIFKHTFISLLLLLAPSYSQNLTDDVCQEVPHPKTRIFKDIVEYQANNMSFDPSNNNFNGNYVSFEPGSIETLERNAFNSFGSNFIIQLSLDHKGIKTVQEEAFLFLGCLKVLDLHANKIESLSKEVFKGLDRLEELDISENFLEEIPENIFKYTKLIKTLNLSGNKIKTLYPESFFNLTLLEKLDLSSNSLTTVPDTTFQYLINLKVLQLNSNKIQEINPQKWSSLGSLSILNLSKNLLKSFDPGYDFPFKNLSNLYLGDNQLTKFNVFALRANLPNVAVLTLDGNNWLCSDLMTIVSLLRNTNINYKGPNATKIAIDGISCKNNASSTVLSTLVTPQVEGNASTVSSTPSQENLRGKKIELEILESVRRLETLVLTVLVIMALFIIADVMVRSRLLPVICRRHVGENEAENVSLLRH